MEAPYPLSRGQAHVPHDQYSRIALLYREHSLLWMQNVTLDAEAAVLHITPLMILITVTRALLCSQYFVAGSHKVWSLIKKDCNCSKPLILICSFILTESFIQIKTRRGIKKKKKN